MTDSGIISRYDVARKIIGEAAEIALRFARERDQLVIEAKGPQDFVSQADRTVEAHIRERLIAAFPDDAFVGEESGTGGAQGASGVWVVDPIDGTQPFLLGLPFWSISIAYVRDDEVLIGLVMNPTTGDLYAAYRGGGATLNGKQTRVLQADALDQGLIGVGCSMRTTPQELGTIMERLLAQQGMFLRIGSGALNIAYVASGQLIGYLEMHINGWDCLAALCVCEEAGAVSSDFIRSYGIAGGGRLVVGAPGVYEALIGLLPEEVLN